LLSFIEKQNLKYFRRKTLIKDNIGNTALEKHEALSRQYGTGIWIKEEFRNPGGSSKDRVAWYMVQDAIQHNKIPEDGIFVEASSGNTGISLALIARELGYQCKIFVSKSTSLEKILMLQRLGAQVEVCLNSNGPLDENSTQFIAKTFADQHPEAYFTNQYYNDANIEAHYQTTGPEIWKQMEGHITHVLIGMGTGGTISGIGKYLKEKNPNIQVWGVEPMNSIYQLIVQEMPIPEDQPKFDPIEGIGRTFIPGSFDPSVVDQVFQVSADKSKKIAHLFSHQNKQLTGYSSAAVLAALDEHADVMNLKSSDRMVLVFPDHGDRYLEKLYSNKAGNKNGDLGFKHV